MDEDTRVESRRRECVDIIGQFRDAETLRDSGAITQEEYAARKGRFIACVRVIELLEGGEWVDDERFARIIREEVASVDVTTLASVGEVADAVADLSVQVDANATDVADNADALAELSEVVSKIIDGGE